MRNLLILLFIAHFPTLTFADWREELRAPISEGTSRNVLVGGLLTSWALSSAFQLGLRIAPGWGQARAHLSGDTEQWSRDAFRFEASVFVSLSW